LGAKDAADRDMVVNAMKGKVVGAGNLIGTFQSSK
jgi:hypothetical protein